MMSNQYNAIMVNRQIQTDQLNADITIMIMVMMIIRMELTLSHKLLNMEHAYLNCDRLAFTNHIHRSRAEENISVEC